MSGMTPDSDFSLPEKSRAGFARIERKATTKSDLEPPAAALRRRALLQHRRRVDLLLGELETA
jgi:hypothetical protein